MSPPQDQRSESAPPWSRRQSIKTRYNTMPKTQDQIRLPSISQYLQQSAQPHNCRCIRDDAFYGTSIPQFKTAERLGQHEKLYHKSVEEPLTFLRIQAPDTLGWDWDGYPMLQKQNDKASNPLKSTRATGLWGSAMNDVSNSSSIEARPIDYGNKMVAHTDEMEREENTLYETMDENLVDDALAYGRISYPWHKNFSTCRPAFENVDAHLRPSWLPSESCGIQSARPGGWTPSGVRSPSSQLYPECPSLTSSNASSSHWSDFSTSERFSTDSEVDPYSNSERFMRNSLGFAKYDQERYGDTASFEMLKTDTHGKNESKPDRSDNDVDWAWFSYIFQSEPSSLSSTLEPCDPNVEFGGAVKHAPRIHMDPSEGDGRQTPNMRSNATYATYMSQDNRSLAQRSDGIVTTTGVQQEPSSRICSSMPLPDSAREVTQATPWPIPSVSVSMIHPREGHSTSDESKTNSVRWQKCTDVAKELYTKTKLPPGWYVASQSETDHPDLTSKSFSKDHFRPNGDVATPTASSDEHNRHCIDEGDATWNEVFLYSTIGEPKDEVGSSLKHVAAAESARIDIELGLRGCDDDGPAAVATSIPHSLSSRNDRARLDHTPKKTPRQDDPGIPLAELAPSEPSESPHYGFGSLGYTPESANQLALVNPASSLLEKLIFEYRNCPRTDEGSPGSTDEISTCLKPLYNLDYSPDTAPNRHLSLLQSSPSDTSGSDTSGNKISGSQSSFSLSTGSTQDSALSNISKRSRDDDDPEDDNGQDKKRQKLTPARPGQQASSSEMILCVHGDCPGQNPSISEWMRKLSTAHNIYICTRCWDFVPENQYRRHLVQQGCEDMCVCDPSQTDIQNLRAQSAHRRIPSECVKNPGRLKRCQYLYVCKMLDIQPREFKHDGAKPHNGEKSRGRPQIADEIVVQAERIQETCNALKEENKKQRGHIEELKGIILQFKELVDGRAISIPESILRRMRTHAADILGKEQSPKPASNIAAMNPPNNGLANTTNDRATLCAPESNPQFPQQMGCTAMPTGIGPLGYVQTHAAAPANRDISSDPNPMYPRGSLTTPMQNYTRAPGGADLRQYHNTQTDHLNFGGLYSMPSNSGWQQQQQNTTGDVLEQVGFAGNQAEAFNFDQTAQNLDLRHSYAGGNNFEQAPFH